MDLKVDLQLEVGTFLAISGPSGSGKTTLLRILAGLNPADSGYISFDGQVWLHTDKKINVRTQDRQTGFVFQDYALFPNMNVRSNLEYALQKNQPREEVDELIRIMELEELTDRYPHALSGGQQQRVALARALVRRPSLLLLDEPLSALDQELRTKLQRHVLHVHRSFGLTTIMVSHDQGEIASMADREIRLEEGEIVYDRTFPGEAPADEAPVENAITGLVVDSFTESGRCKVVIQSDTGRFVLPWPSGQQNAPRPGSRIRITLDPVSEYEGRNPDESRGPDD